MDKTKNIIEVKELTKYYKEVKAVDAISFAVKEGSLFAFLGENGAGKSTTINVLCTVLAKTSGKVFVAGHDLDKEPDKIRNTIGIVFQGSVLDGNLTIKENLVTRGRYYGLGKKEILNRISELDIMLGLKDILKRKYDNLSGGQRRRADIARALMHKPKLLFLDEPTTGLDPKTRKLVWETINSLRKKEGLTVFLTTHYMEETLNADEVVIIDEGKIIADDTPAGLKSKYTTNRLLWYAEKTATNDELLTKAGFKFTYKVDFYRISFNEYEEIIEFISQNKSRVNNFEIIKGNMDDVFLTITGRKLGD